MTKQIQSLKRQSGGLRKRLLEFQEFINKRNELYNNNGKLGRVDLIEIETRLKDIMPILKEYREVQNKIEDIEKDDVTTEDESFEDSFYSAISIAKFLLEVPGSLESKPVPEMPKFNPIQNSEQSNIKLPTIELPKYSGNYTKWLEFRDTYEALIHKSDKLTDIQKFYYLKSSLEGDAAKVITCMEMSASNYNNAWKSLCDRYENKRLLVHNHIRALFNLPTVSKESSKQLREILDSITQHLRALGTLNQPVETWDSLIIFIVSSKFDSVTSREWEAENGSNTLPTLNELKTFLKKRAEMLETVNYSKIDLTTEPNSKIKGKVTGKTFLTATGLKCYNCQGAHTIYNCKQFLELTIENRLAQIRNKKLCGNCLRPGHVAKDCSARGCKVCQVRHNTLLHRDKQNETKATSEQEQDPNVYITRTNNTMYAILSTVEVQVSTDRGNKICRAILDTGSQSNLIARSAAERINAEIVPMRRAVKGLGNCETKILGKCYVSIESRTSSFKIRVECLVVPGICDEFSQNQLSKYRREVDKFNLADPKFDKAGKIDLLIGNCVFWNLISDGNHNLGPGKPILQNTTLGWVLAGPLLLKHRTSQEPRCHFSKDATNEIQAQLAKFWEIEECSNTQILSNDEKQCESHFINTFERNEDGRFIVSMPFKKPVELLGNSKPGALRRFYNLEHKLQLQPKFREQYGNFLREYEELGHMSKVELDKDSEKTYYLPHHGVINESSTTTRLRVVFDASFVTSSGYSLNNLQCVGPIIQNDLICILLRFRQHAVAVSADITKMYRQVLIKPDERDLQRIVWRNNPSEPISVFNLNTVTYGTASASFLAIRCLQQLADENALKFPEASSVIRNDFYVDDMLTGADTPEKAAVICEQVASILKQGCFPLRKWITNCPQVLSIVNAADENNCSLSIGENEKTKTLGLYWIAQTDNLMFNVNTKISNSVTKRSILSIISQIFDPLGLLGACVIKIKILLQLIWQEKLDWDQVVPSYIQKEWSEFCNELHVLNSVSIPRHVVCQDAVSVELHGFSDASERAYGACVYLRSEDNLGHVLIRLLCSKAKVAPLKTITVPRLELCAALLLAKLTQKVVSSLTISFRGIFLWSDSQIVLSWLQTPPNTLKIFVANRIVQINELIPDVSWKYVPTSSNPADIISRGISPQDLSSSSLWWNGPDWLTETHEAWPNQPLQLNKEIPDLRTNPLTCVAISNPDVIDVERFSSLNKLVNVMAFCLRFKHNCMHQKSERKYGSITAQEKSETLKVLIKISQRQSYPQELKDLEEKGKIKNNSSLLALAPYIDEQKFMRVGGRLQLSGLNYNEKHPIILNSNNHLTKLIFRDAHKQLIHGGVQQMLCYVREKYWPIKARNLAKRIVRECIVCFRANPKKEELLMGILPRTRVNPSFPFQNTGVDYAGPFTIKTRKGRGVKTSKCYISLFVCFAVKAIHLEIVSDLSTEAFLAALRRFVARRGRPSNLYSDNATNFVGAERELGRWLEESLNNDKIIDAFALEGMTWHFIPPRAPHFGGLWESSVRRAKFHLKRVLYNTTLTFEELYTLTCQVEAILNSRPLTPMSDDPNDMQPLTPSHFLIGRTLTAIPEPDILQTNPRLLSNFKRTQQMVQSFWKRWSHEYLQQLNPRKKWRESQSTPMAIGDLVIVQEDSQPPLSWQLGRIVETFTGPDGRIRVAMVKTARGIFKRAWSKLFPLPKEDNNVEEGVVK